MGNSNITDTYSFWKDLLESMGFEYSPEPEKDIWGWRSFFKNGFRVSFMPNTAPQGVDFEIQYQDKLINWSYPGIPRPSCPLMQELLDVLEAIVNPKLWPLCIGIDWNKTLVSDFLGK
jgi:hypothetical protein